MLSIAGVTPEVAERRAQRFEKTGKDVKIWATFV
jgi:hypothetical protein